MCDGRGAETQGAKAAAPRFHHEAAGAFSLKKKKTRHLHLALWGKKMGE